MKTLKKLSLFLLVILLCVSLVGCGEKVAKTPEEFNDFMESKDFTVADSTLFAQTVVTAKTVLTALNDNYEIEFYELNCNDTSKEFYNLNKEAFLNEESSNTTTEITGSNFDYFDMTNDSGFRMTSRIDNTVIYCYTEVEYKDEVKKLIKEFGY